MIRSLNRQGDDDIRASVLQQVRNKLESSLSDLDKLSGAGKGSEPKEIAGRVTEAMVRSILSERRSRSEFFKDDLFADPAWDMLLELYASELAQHRISVSRLCEGAAVPPTTALRWIKRLEDEGLLVREGDPLDARRVHVRLSTDASSRMSAYFQRLGTFSAL